MCTCPAAVTPVRAATISATFLHSEAATRASQTTLAVCIRAEPLQMQDEGAYTLTGTSKEPKTQVVTNFPAMLTGKPALQSPLALCQVFCSWTLGKSCPQRCCCRAQGSPECTNLRSYCRTSLRAPQQFVCTPPCTGYRLGTVSSQPHSNLPE